jgi:hypothetical protein
MNARYDALTEAAEIVQAKYDEMAKRAYPPPKVIAELVDAILALRDSPAVQDDTAPLVLVDRSKWTPLQRVLEVIEWLKTDPRVTPISLDAVASLGEVRNVLLLQPAQPPASEAWKRWRDADPEALEPFYSKWVGLLTSEGLHAKADIATVLALLDRAALRAGGGSKAIAEIADERARQVEKEEWSHQHDDEHTDGSLAAAAAAYAWPEPRMKMKRDDVPYHRYTDAPPSYHTVTFRVPLCWPDSWNGMYWKPKDRRRDLVRAGALIVAELERMDRVAPSRDGDNSEAGGKRG